MEVNSDVKRFTEKKFNIPMIRGMPKIITRIPGVFLSMGSKTFKRTLTSARWKERGFWIWSSGNSLANW